MEAGELTPEILGRALDEIWRPRRPVLPWGYRDLLEGLPPEPVDGHCGAVLLAPDESVKNAFRAELTARNIPVHPGHAVYFEPSQGPAPLRCELEPHPPGTWHREGRTWWR